MQQCLLAFTKNKYDLNAEYAALTKSHHLINDETDVRDGRNGGKRTVFRHYIYLINELPRAEQIFSLRAQVILRVPLTVR
jgi:hypothetical protein